MSALCTSPSRSCPALLVSATASRQGKTLATAALARLHARRGRKVRVFKCGPDFLDPQILAQASGSPVYQLDLWIQGPEECRRLLWQAAGQADLILVEGVMGLFDGNPSSADLGAAFNIPALAVIDVSAMAGTAAAVAYGLANFDRRLLFAGIIANRAGSERHREMVRQTLLQAGQAGRAELKYLGGLLRSPELELPSRHLGLLQAGEIPDLLARLDLASDMLADGPAGELPEAVTFRAPEGNTSQPELLLAGLRIGIARDEAFSFIYQANLDLLRERGAELVFFSPLRERLPEVDSLYLPGGYPELHLEQLRDNRALLGDIRQHHAAGKPILAECGGMLYLLEKLRDQDGREAELAGLLPGQARMRPRLAALGSQSLDLPEGSLRGHTFHHSSLECQLEPIARACYPDGREGEAAFRLGSLTASYVHAYFPSNPQAACRLFKGSLCQP